MTELLGALGRGSSDLLAYVGGMTWLLVDSLYFTFVAPFGSRRLKIRRDPVFAQMARVGFDSLGVVCIVLLFIGMVLALQMAYILKKFGVTAYVGSVVGLGMFRELGPLLTAIVMSGYVGAAIAAEIGTMSVSEEIEALSASAIHPVRFLVVPRLLATTIMVPCVTMIGDFVGILGGMFIGYTVLKIAPALFIQKLIEPLVVKDVLTGVFKSGVFAAVIALISCFEGLRVDSGAEGVGRATTRSVVFSIVMIIAADCAITTLFYFVLGD
ncbi:MAG: ABC transporter permease [Elusimicrobia bacterium]|nr:ABC transporter permease [Elusimicrobiota bacterium]